MRANGAFEPMQQQDPRCPRRRRQAMQLQEITIRSFPALERSRRWELTPEKLSPERLQMTAGNPPGRRIDYLTPHFSGYQVRLHPFISVTNQVETLDVQIFGIRKSADTRKALRFFSERRIKTHFVDLLERPASLGELRRFAQKFGVTALIDRDSKRFSELGLQYAQLSDERWLQKLSEEPLLLRLPLVRNANQVVVGADEATWKGWLER